MDADRPRKPATQAERRQATQNAILQAGAEVFSEHGFDGARVSEIAARAGVGEGTVFLHFGNKRGLFHATTRISYDQMIDAARAVLSGPDTAIDQLKTITRNHLDVLERNWRVVISLLGPQAFHGDSLHDREFYERNREYRRMFRDHIQGMKDQGILRADVDPGVMRDMIFGSIEYFSTGHFGTGRDYDLDAYLDNLWDLLLAGVLARPEASKNEPATLDQLDQKLDLIIETLNSKG